MLCRSLGPHMEALIEQAVWNCMRKKCPVTYLSTQIVPMLCELPQYIGWGLTGQPTWWLEVQLHAADLHLGQTFLVSVWCVCLMNCSCSLLLFLLCFIHISFCFLLLIFLVSLHNVTLNFVLS